VTTTKRTYEVLYIIDITSTDEQIQSVADKFSGVVTEQGGEVIAAGLWDKRRMAYDIKGKGEGCYILMYFTGEATLCLELDRVMRISDDIIRHMILNIEPELVDISLIRKPGSEAPVAPAVEAPVAAEPAEVVEEAEAVETVETVEAPAVVEVVEETAAPVTEEEPVAAAEPVVEE
jgi:small subunit ribosomal protein S6